MVKPRQFELADANDGLASSMGKAVSTGKNNESLFSTDRGMHIKYSSQSRMSRIEDLKSFDQDHVMSAVQDSQGRFWVAQSSRLSIVEDGLTKPIFSNGFDQHTSNGSLVSDFESKMIAELSDGRILVGGNNGIAVFKSAIEYEFLHHPIDDSPIKGCSLATESHSDTVWIGTHGQGLLKYQQGVVEQVLSPGAIPVNKVSQVASSQENQALVFSEGNKLFIFDEISKQTYPISFSGEIELEKVCQLLFDSDLNLWVAHLGALLLVEEKDCRAWKAHLNRMGEVSFPARVWTHLPTLDFNSDSNHPKTAICSDGSLWFTTLNGFLHFNPENLDDISNQIPTRLDTIRTEASCKIAYLSNNLMGSSGNAESWCLYPGEAITFQIDGFGMENQKAIETRYRLNGGDWQRLEGDEISINPESQGVLSVDWQIRSRYHSWPNTIKNQTVHIIYPWYYREETKAFAGLLFLGFLGQIGWNVHRRIQTRSKIEKEVARMEERTQLARDLHDVLGMELTSIQREIEYLKQEIKTIPSAPTLKNLESSVSECKDSFRGLLWVKMPSTKSLESLTLYLMEYLSQSLNKSNIKLNIQTPDTFPNVEFRDEFCREILLIFKELIHNILKHSKATKVYFKVAALDEKTWIINLKDNGIGITTKTKQVDRIDGNGFGLENLKLRAEKIHGKFHCQTSFEGGLSNTIEIPICMLTNQNNTLQLKHNEHGRV